MFTNDLLDDHDQEYYDFKEQMHYQDSIITASNHTNTSANVNTNTLHRKASKLSTSSQQQLQQQLQALQPVEDDMEDLQLHDPRYNHITVEELQEHTMNLNTQLEAEIVTLNGTVSQHQTETKTAMETAQKYADKYLQLREDYELHIERLMLKLTQEQQARAILEDQLEAATKKMYVYSRELQEKQQRGSSGSIFNWFRKSTDVTSAYSSSGGKNMGSER
jgi:hypothetical protein